MTSEKKQQRGADVPSCEHSCIPAGDVPIITIYPNHWRKRWENLPFLQFLQDIRSGTGTSNRQLIDRIRKTTSEDQQKKLKAQLQCATISGTFQGAGQNADLVQHSQLVCIDVDQKENPQIFAEKEQIQLLLQKVRAQPFYIADWSSARLGKSFVFKIRPTQHQEAFEGLRLFFKSIGVNIDTRCKNVSRLRYTSYDPGLQYSSQLEHAFNQIPYYEPQLPAKSKPAARPQSSTLPADDDTVISYVLKIAEKNGYAFIPGKRHEFTLYISSLLNQFGVPLSTALDVLQQQTVGSENPEHHRQVLSDIYKRYRHQHGQKDYQKLEAKYLPNSHQKVDTLVQEKDITYLQQSIYIKRYLSEIELPEHERLILNVPTNGGKTRYFCKKATGRRILLVPTVALAMQVQYQYGVKAIYEGVAVSKYDEVLVSTYESLPKILLTLKNIGSYQLWVDEAHNLVQASSMSYRNKALTQVSESFDFFNRVILLSGTWISTQAAPLQDFKLVNVINEGKKVGKFFLVPTKNKLHSITRRIATKPNVLHVVYVNSVNKAEATAKTLSDIGVGRFVAIHADNKNDQEQKEIINTGLLPEGVQGIVVTDVFKEGLSLLNKCPFIVHLFSKADSVTTEQIINRVREVIPETFCYVDTKAKKSTKTFTEAERFQFEREKLAKAGKMVHHLEELRELSFNVAGLWKLIRADRKAEQTLWDKDDVQLVIMPHSNEESVKINHFGIANSGFQKWSKIEKNNPQLYLDNLRAYGYTVEILETEKEQDEQLKNLQKTNELEVKELEERRVQEILEEFENEGADYVEDMHRVQMAPQMKLELAARWLYLYKFIAHIPDITTILSENYPRRAWNRYSTQLNNQIYINTHLEHERSTNRLLRRYMAEFEVNKEYTSTEIERITRRILNRYQDTKEAAATLTKTKAVQDLKLYFTIHSNHKKENYHKIIKWGALDIELKESAVRPAVVEV